MFFIASLLFSSPSRSSLPPTRLLFLVHCRISHGALSADRHDSSHVSIPERSNHVFQCQFSRRDTALLRFTWIVMILRMYPYDPFTFETQKEKKEKNLASIWLLLASQFLLKFQLNIYFLMQSFSVTFPYHFARISRFQYQLTIL